MPRLTPTELARMGGKALVAKKFAGKTKEEISEIMKKVRAGKKEKQT